jgi:hypothetical protein
MLRTKTLRAALLLPGVLAVSYLSNVGTAKADTDLNNQLTQYATDEALPPPAVPKTLTTTNAQANDLVYALYTVLFNDATLTDAEIVQRVKDALPPSRKDRNTIAGRIVAAAIYGSNSEENPSRIKQIVEAVNFSGLSNTGKAAAVAGALRAAAKSNSILATDFSDPTANSGAAIGAASLTLAPGSLTFQKAVIKALGTGAGASNLAPYFKVVLDGLSGNDVIATTLAASTKQPAVAGAVIAGRAAEIVGFAPSPATDQAVKDFVKAAATNAKLKTVVNGVVAGGFAYLSDTATGSRAAAGAALAADPKLKALAGRVAAGALQSRSLLSTESTDDILNAIATAATLTASKVGTFAAQAALGNAPVADEILINSFGRIPASTKDAKVLTALASGVLKAIVGSEASDISDLAATAANLARNGVGVFSDSTKPALAAALAKAATKNYGAAGAATAGVLRTTSNPAGSAVIVSAAAIKGNTKAATGIAQQVSLFLGTGIPDYAKSLAGSVSSALAGAVAAGASITDPSNTGTIVTRVILENSPAVKKQALKIASTVGLAVDIERVGDVAKAIGALLQPKTGGTAGLPKITSITALATALTKAINVKPLRDVNDPLTPNAGWHNRVDEIGELAAVLTNAALAINGGDDAKVLASIGTAIFKGLSKKLLANAGNFQADLKDVARDVAGAIFQSISAASVSGSSQLTSDERDNLLKADGVLAKALIKAAGKFGSDVTAALSDVNGATGNPGRIVTGSEPIGNGTTTGTGRYEIGNIVDPETPVQNI